MPDHSRVERALRAVLPVGTPVSVTRKPSGFLDVDIAGVSFLAAWLELGTPAAVLRAHRDLPGLRLVVANRFTDGGLATVRERALGWLDLFGGAEFVVGTVVVARQGQATPRQRTPGWTAATLGIAEALLLGHKATVNGLRTPTHASPSTIALALASLTDNGLLTAAAARGRHSGRAVVDRRALLDAYATAAADIDARHAITVGVLWRDPIVDLGAFGAALDTAHVTWAATGALAAAVQAPYQTQVSPWVVYVKASTVADLQAAAAAAGLAPTMGGRLELRAFPSPVTEVLCERRDGIPVTPWPRTYADLRFTGVRGEGAADHLADLMLQAQRTPADV